MSTFEKIALIAIGVAFFAVRLGPLVAGAKIAPKWLLRFVVPPTRR